MGGGCYVGGDVRDELAMQRLGEGMSRMNCNDWGRDVTRRRVASRRGRVSLGVLDTTFAFRLGSIHCVLYALRSQRDVTSYHAFAFPHMITCLFTPRRRDRD